MNSNANYNGVEKPINNFRVLRGTTVYQNVQYKNIGLLPDSYKVNVTGIPLSWYSISMSLNGVVDPGQVVSGVIAIRPTLKGNYNFNVTVTSLTDPKVYDNVTYRIRVF